MQGDDRPEQLFVLQRKAPKSDRVNRQRQKPRGSTIYRKGSKPVWADDEDDLESEIQNRPNLRQARKTGSGRIKVEKIEHTRRPVEPEVVSTRTISEPVVEKVEKEEDEEGRDDEKEDLEPKAGDNVVKRKGIDIDVSQLEIPEGPEDEDEDEDEESDVDDRRERMRKKRLEKLEQEELTRERAGHGEEDEDEDEDEDESEYESESEVEQVRTMLKPVFVSKRMRQTIAEKESLEAEEKTYVEEQLARDKEKKEQAMKLVIHSLKLEEEAKLKAKEEEMPDDGDDEDEEEQIKAWKLRELKRIKREQELRVSHEKEQAEIEKRRNMTDEQIEALNRMKPEKERGQMKFLQKYFHKGAFYQDSDHKIFKRDFNQATGLDAEVDRTKLPKVLQVKNFGLMSRTKYTHLVDQDTTFASKSKREILDDEEFKRNKGFGSSKFTKRKLAGTGKIDEVFRKKSKTQAEDSGSSSRRR
mmetsp:Transcript_32347/g.78699  ORF Transcript_32347/g.78699 Transcript_32347/m.78699 type:complete len:471 (-) Transcript_32347:292-1704(-)